ncbi:MAG: UDP-N-acetylglucosamine--N-acetylmuramyl-(pentapeptide) pyrophosphoryl-undecaprenol N-acetylglucosamine transferase [Chlamydiales bacterium]|nr:UDP-N-acetylglucosamine--N-acetylmuramyl-(pentapeptide) pyrophosphoryl-undecaprenol N-acetylglucosamine transferase [Chlamydiales bacterium]
MKKILIAVGGSGGHVIPAHALAQQLQKRDAETDILFAGSGLSKNTYLEHTCYPKRDIVGPKLSLRSPISSLMNCAQIVQGIREGKKLIDQFSPQVIVGFGSFHTLPMMLAAVIRSIPIVLYAADTVPGKVVRLLSSFADVTATHFPDAFSHLRGYKHLVSHPLREEFVMGSQSKERAYHYFNLDSNKHTILVFGGSQGALYINKLMKDAFLRVKERLPSFQVIHFTGSLKWTEELEVFYKRHGISAVIKEFEPRLDLAWQIADMSITRAGASTIAEQIAMEVPGILIPYPTAADNHQNKNADYMMWNIKGGMKLLESKASSQIIADKVISFFCDDKALIKNMKKHIQVYKENTSREELASIVQRIVEKAGK